MNYPIQQPRILVDRRELAGELAPLVTAPLAEPERRATALDLVKGAYRRGYAELRRRFEATGNGTATVHETCFLIDQIVRAVHDYAAALAFPGEADPAAALSVVAVGGYGRGELAPHSDLDLLFLMPGRRDPRYEQVVQTILYLLWDTGLKVGHSTRTVEECLKEAKADLTIRTAVLEARWLWGDQQPFNTLMTRFRKSVVAGSGPEFVEAKLAERDERHARLGEARYVLEPNIKEGKGGLRDLHTLTWIAKYLYDIPGIEALVPMGMLPEEAAARFAKAQTFLWTVRCHLHFLTGRTEDRLTFDIQPEIARRMHYTDHGGSLGVERFMKHYFLIAKDVGDLTRIFTAVLEEQHKRRPRLRLGLLLAPREVDGFSVVNGRLDVRSEDAFAREPIRLLSLFHTAFDQDLDIHPRALSLVTRNLRRIDAGLRADPEANRLFMAMLTSKKDPEGALRLMNEAGVLGRFIPDFGRVVAQMQYDMYHVYTVDEHTIRAIGVLRRLEAGQMAEMAPAASEVMRSDLAESSRRALYVGLFCHDIAKGRGGDHSDLGCLVAQKLGPRLGLTEEETETAAWLVKYHLLMTRVAYKRDIDDPRVVDDFIAIVQSPERLKLLLALTVADVYAVGPAVWNAWKAGLLRDLYYNALTRMSGGIALDQRQGSVAAAKARLRERLTGVWKEAEIAAHLALGYPSYWIGFDVEHHLRHAMIMREARMTGAPLTIDTRVFPARAVTEVTVYTPDHAGLFAQIAGGMALSGASIVDANINTMADGMALDVFQIQDQRGEAFASPGQTAKLSVNLERAMEGRLRIGRELASRQDSKAVRSKMFAVPPRVLADNLASPTSTVIEVNGRDRIGLLYDLTSALTRLNLQIAAAHVSTYGERVVDVFYVKDVFGLKVEHPRRLQEIRETLLQVLREPAAEPVAAE